MALFRAVLSLVLLRLFRTRVTYRAETLQRLRNGPAIVVCNHVSLLDGLLVALASPVPMLFAVDGEFSVRSRSTRAALQMLSVIGYGWVVPLNPGSPFGVRALHKALASGTRVMLFPEGAISEDGAAQPRMPGVTWLAARTGLPVLELQIRGAEASRFFAKAGTRFWPTIHLLF